MKKEEVKVEYYDNGNKKRETHYKDGEKEGVETYWNEDGNKDMESHYKDGKLDGVCTEWEDGTKLFHSCRQWPGADGEVSDYVYGTRGTAAIQNHRIDGEVKWRFDGSPNEMYDAEWKELFRSVKGERERINNGEYMCDSTLASILGRTCAYTGKTIT